MPHSRPPRILFIWHAAVVPSYRKLLEQLHAVSGADLHLIVPERWPEAGLNLSAPAGPAKGYFTHVLRTWFIGRHYLYFMPGLAGKLKALRPDVIYCYAGPYWLNTFWTLWLVQLNKVRLNNVRSNLGGRDRARQISPAPRVVFVSDQTLHKTYPAPFCWFESWVLKHADFATSCDAEGVARLEQKGFPAGRAATVPLGFDAELFYPDPCHHPGTPPHPEARHSSEMLQEPGIVQQPLRILYVGRLLQMKGVHDLITACGMLTEPFRLTIVGDGPERENLRRQSEANRLPVTFLGTREPGFVAALMRTSDVLVLPSRTVPGKWKEQFGRVLVEAMACGCVPVGSDSGAIRTVIGAGGLIFPEGDASALASCLGALAGDREQLARLREQALTRAHERYSWTAIARLLWATLQRVLRLPSRELDSNRAANFESKTDRETQLASNASAASRVTL